MPLQVKLNLNLSKEEEDWEKLFDSHDSDIGPDFLPNDSSVLDHDDNHAVFGNIDINIFESDDVCDTIIPSEIKSVVINNQSIVGVISGRPAENSLSEAYKKLKIKTEKNKMKGEAEMEWNLFHGMQNDFTFTGRFK